MISMVQSVISVSECSSMIVDHWGTFRYNNGTKCSPKEMILTLLQPFWKNAAGNRLEPG